MTGLMNQSIANICIQKLIISHVVPVKHGKKHETIYKNIEFLIITLKNALLEEIKNVVKDFVVF